MRIFDYINHTRETMAFGMAGRLAADGPAVIERDVEKHTFIEDALAFATGATFAALGICLLKNAALITGGATGITLLLCNLTGMEFALMFLLVNIPFFMLGLVTSGFRYLVKSAAGMFVVALATRALPQLIHIEPVHPLLSATLGGLLLGVGMLIIIRHGGSVGGLNIFSLYIQEKAGISAGKVQLAIDAAIIVTSAFAYSAQGALVSILSVVAVNLVLITNHKTGRYSGS
jgi:uncharacterized membrane-anchored protein YitT (DUF2179 family)